MSLHAFVTGTGWRNEDGSSRSRIIRRHCQIGTEVEFRKVPPRPPESHGVAVVVKVPRLMGLLPAADKTIGFVEAKVAARLLARLDAGETVRARVRSLHAPIEKDEPRVGLALDE